MNNKKFENISMKGRMAYLILCIETYLNELFPDVTVNDHTVSWLY